MYYYGSRTVNAAASKLCSPRLTLNLLEQYEDAIVINGDFALLSVGADGTVTIEDRAE